MFDIKRFTWTELSPSPTTPSPRAECGMVVMNEILYLFGGALVRGENYGELFHYYAATDLAQNKLGLSYIHMLTFEFYLDIALTMFSSQKPFMQICFPSIL